MPRPLWRTRRTSSARRWWPEQHETQDGAGSPPLIAPQPAAEPTSTPKILGSGIALPSAHAPRAVREAELLDRDGRREGHDGEGHPADAQRGRAGGKPSRRRDRHREHRRDGEAHARLVARCDTANAATPASGTCSERDLPHVAGDDDERQADDRPGERDADGEAVVERHDEQRHDDHGDATRSPAAPGASGRGLGQPRLDQLAPGRQARAPHHSATTMTRNVSTALTPGSGTPPSVGNHACVCA